MQWNLERPAGATALMLAVGVFLTTAAPKAAAEYDQTVLPAEIVPLVMSDPIETAETPPPVETPPETTAESEPAPQGEPVRLAVYMEELLPGTALTLAGPDGATGDLTVPPDGVLTLTLRPGRWTIGAGSWSASFTLRQNASVAEPEGACWTDGESLTLSQAVRGTLIVSKTVLGAAEETTYLYRLTGAALENDSRALLFAPGGETTQYCSFWALPQGSYTLWENDAPVATFAISETIREHMLTLG